MKFENTAIYNMMAAIKAARLSYGSESDSPKHEGEDAVHNDDWHYPFVIGPKDTELIKKLVARGSSHRKFMRAILLTVDITAPRYWWVQFDTYKVGVTTLSESTMHTLMKSPIAQSDFSAPLPESWIVSMELFRQKGDFGQLVAMLPQGYLQKRHVAMNYEVVRNIIAQRRGHKLAEWAEFIEWAQGLPQAELFFGDLMKGDKE